MASVVSHSPGGRSIGRRSLLAGMAAVGVAGARCAGAAEAAEPLTLATNWYAQAELGGFYSAVATGCYQRQGLAVTIRSGGPQVNAMQLLLGGQCDLIIAQPEAVVTAVLNGLPVVTIGATFQKCMTGFLVHPDIADLAALKGHPILISTEARATYWPWLRRTFGYSDAQAGVYTFNMQPFVHDLAMAIQSFISSEPYAAERQGIPFRFLLFDDAGYPSYSNAVVVSRRLLEQRPDMLLRFLRASAEGWIDYLHGDARPGDAAIRADNPNVTADHLAWSRARLRAVHGMGPAGGLAMAMDDHQWGRIGTMVCQTAGIADTGRWKGAYTLDLVRHLTATLPA